MLVVQVDGWVVPALAGKPNYPTMGRFHDAN
jgi:hypothetical protein